jgi:hypothetical protein
MFRMAYTQGAQHALEKYAGVGGDAFRAMLASPNLKRNLNVAGLGLIAAPTIHSMVSNGEDSPGLEKTKHLSDLAGLGMLIGTEFMKH